MTKRILIIDDDLYIRDLYKEILMAEGYEITIATDGEEGLKYLLEGGFSIVLLDIMMPKLDGIGVLTKIKESPPQNPNGPIILLTNLDHDPILAQALSLGAAKCFLKAEMLPQILIQRIKEVLGRELV